MVRGFNRFIPPEEPGRGEETADPSRDDSLQAFPSQYSMEAVQEGSVVPRSDESMDDNVGARDVPDAWRHDIPRIVGGDPPYDGKVGRPSNN